MSGDAILIEGLLEDFIVVNKLVLVLGSPVYLADWESSWIDRVNNLAIY